MEFRGNRETSTNREAGGGMQAIRKAMVPTDFWTIVKHFRIGVTTQCIFRWGQCKHYLGIRIPEKKKNLRLAEKD